MTGIRVLVVDDEVDMLENCERLLSRAGYRVRTLSEPTGVRSLLNDFRPEVVCLDLRMPKADGMMVLAVLLAEDPDLPVIIMTGFASVSSAVAAIREGAFDYLSKPFSGEQLLATVERAARHRGAGLGHAARLPERGPIGIIGRSPSMRRLSEQINLVAATDASVLITGESGTGKELVARSIHASSGRQGPFVPIDCAALPDELLESELFGHERGAFTGAVARKVGLLIEAGGGTVLLDEIGDLSAELQAKLLRTLEERSIRPVGSTTFVPIDVRMLAATNVDLSAAVRAGNFRQDLYYRLNVVHLTVPPLRSRPGDLTLLFDEFLKRFATELGRPVPKISPDAWTRLEAHPWPGNVRELRNMAQRLVVLDTDGRITLSDLPDAIRGWSEDGGAEPSPGPVTSYVEARDEALTDFRREYVRRLLAAHGGNVSRAAMAAGVSRRTLHRWLAEGHEHSPEEETG